MRKRPIGYSTDCLVSAMTKRMTTLELVAATVATLEGFEILDVLGLAIKNAQAHLRERELIAETMDDSNWFAAFDDEVDAIRETEDAFFADLYSGSSRTRGVLDPGDEWLRQPGSATLHLIGNMLQPVMTQALLSTLLNESLDKALEYVSESDEERLPYRLIVVLDEMANLAPVRRIETYFATVRSARIQIIAVLQSLSQAVTLLGPHIATTLMVSATTKLYLSGLTDADLVGDLSSLGGTQHIDLNDLDNLSVTSLISGHDLVTLQAPNAKTGAPGEGIFLGSGGFVRVEVPFWALTPPFEDRGVLMPQHRAAMDALKKPKGRFASWAMKLQDS